MPASFASRRLTALRRFYFSYNYDISRTLQSNMGGYPRPLTDESSVRRPPPSFSCFFPLPRSCCAPLL